MRNRSGLNNLLNRDRKLLYTVLSILLVSVLTLTVVYAALSTTLNINGQAEVTAASWDIHFNNIQINSGSVEATTIPKIIDSKTINFVVNLKEPGDYYKFTVDIVNEGTIDAMIDSVVKTPELSTTQAKYIKYEIEYTDGNSINSKQLLPKDSTKTISVLVAYRSDVASTNIPTTGESLSLSFTMIYTQADETGTEIPESTPVVRVVSGDYDTVGSEIAIGEEHFYVISSDKDSVTMLAKYNLLIGNKYDVENGVVEIPNPTGIQDETAKGWFSGYTSDNPYIGTKPFSSTNYWKSTVKSYPSYVYNENSYLYEYVENYKRYLEDLGATINDARLITIKELESIGCSSSSNSCRDASSWVYATTYWTGEANSEMPIWIVDTLGNFLYNYDYTRTGRGVRPVITISKSEF